MKLVVSNYQGLDVSFSEEGWFNATVAAERLGKRVDKWLGNQETQDYLAVLCEVSNTPKTGYLKTKRGNNGGTWLHPDLAVAFARWLDIRFAIWCDRQIRSIIAGSHPHHDWKLKRHAASSSDKVMKAVLKLQREQVGKETQDHHYSNEARMINFVLVGEFCGLDRNNLNADELDLLAKLEEKNAVLLASGLGYENRKASLLLFAAQLRQGGQLCAA